MEKKRGTIYIGADHAGLKLKNFLKEHLQKQGYTLYDLGAHELNKRDDYPDFAAKVAREVADNSDSKGILCCGSAQGMCIAANKIPTIRAVAVTNIKEAKITRSHNNSNVLCLAGWYMPRLKALRIADAWLSEDFSQNERHVRRLKKIAKLER